MMSAPWIDPFVALFCTVCIGGTLLGLLELLRSTSTNKKRWIWVERGVAVVVVGFSTVAALLGQPLLIWLPPLTLIGVWAVCQLARIALCQRVLYQVGVLLCSARFHAALLLLGCPTVGAWWIIRLAEPEPLQPFNWPGALGEPNRNLEEVTTLTVVTDKGRKVRVYRCLSRVKLTPAVLAQHTNMLRERGFQEQVMMLPDLDLDTNCFGHVFTGGLYWIADPRGIEAILQDNGYQLVDEPQVGDVAIYRGEGERIVHTGIVRAAGKEGPVLIESKWGEMSNYIHPPDLHPYPWTTCYFYRSARPNHTLRGLPGAPTEAKDAVEKVKDMNAT